MKTDEYKCPSCKWKGNDNEIKLKQFNGFRDIVICDEDENIEECKEWEEWEEFVCPECESIAEYIIYLD